MFSLDPELKDELISIISKLLADKTIVSLVMRLNDLGKENSHLVSQW